MYVVEICRCWWWKKNSIKTRVRFSRIKIMMSSNFCKRKMIDLNDVFRFLIYFVFFQNFWTFSAVFAIAFRWLKHNVFLISRFFDVVFDVIFLRIFRISRFETIFFWKIFRVWLILFLIVLHALLRLRIAWLDVEILKIKFALIIDIVLLIFIT